MFIQNALIITSIFVFISCNLALTNSGGGSASSNSELSSSASSNRAPEVSANYVYITPNSGQFLMSIKFVNDPDGDTLNFSLDSNANLGQASLSEQGAFSYTPNPGVQGIETLNFSVTDSAGKSSSSTIYVSIDPENAVSNYSEFTLHAIGFGSNTSSANTTYEDQINLPVSGNPIEAGTYIIENGSLLTKNYRLTNTGATTVTISNIELSDSLIETDIPAGNVDIAPGSFLDFSLGIDANNVVGPGTRTGSIFVTYSRSNAPATNLSMSLPFVADVFNGPNNNGNIPLQVYFVENPASPGNAVNSIVFNNIKNLIDDRYSHNGGKVLSFDYLPPKSISQPNAYNITGSVGTVLSDLAFNHSSTLTVNVFVVNSTIGGLLGLAYVDAPPTAGSLLSSFFIVASEVDDVIPQNLNNAGSVVPHELGHNIGLGHSAYTQFGGLPNTDVHNYSKNNCFPGDGGGDFSYTTYLLFSGVQGELAARKNVMSALASNNGEMFNANYFNTYSSIIECYDEIARSNLGLYQ